MTRMEKRKRYICILCLVVYLILVTYITILSRTPSLARIVRVVSFWSYLDWIRGNWQRGLSIVLNIGLFIPVGYLLAGIQPAKVSEKHWTRWTLVIVITLLFTISIEVAQYFLYLGFFDIDDIINNGLGGTIGILLYEKVKDWKWSKYIPVVMLIAVFFSSLITTTNKVVYETQFNFEVSRATVLNGRLELDGICTVYNRDGLEYQILLRGNEAEHRAETVLNGEKFVASVEPVDGELYVQFRGYRPIATSVYVHNGEITYVPINTSEPNVNNTDIEFIVKVGTPMAYNAEYNAYVYQVGRRLYWLIGEDFDASVIYHLYTAEPDKLPEDRQQYGFDNRGFRNGSEKELTKTMNCGRYRVFTDIIPSEYKVTAIAVGMNKGPDVYWREYFRPLR